MNRQLGQLSPSGGCGQTAEVLRVAGHDAAGQPFQVPDHARVKPHGERSGCDDAEGR